MDSLFAIGLGLGLRFLVDVVTQHDFRVGGSLVGLWEGAVLYHFIGKMPRSNDPYIAYAVRLFVDFLFTESWYKLALVLLWTGLGLVLSDIAPCFWYDIGLRKIVRRFRRDMGLLGVPLLSFSSKPPNNSRVRFHSPTRASAPPQPRVPPATTRARHPSLTPSNASSSSTTPTITPNQKPSGIPGTFSDVWSKDTHRDQSAPADAQTDESSSSSVVDPDIRTESSHSDSSSEADPSAENPRDIPEEEEYPPEKEDGDRTPTMRGNQLPNEPADNIHATDGVQPPHVDDVPAIPDVLDEKLGKEVRADAPLPSATADPATPNVLADPDFLPIPPPFADDSSTHTISAQLPLIPTPPAAPSAPSPLMDTAAGTPDLVDDKSSSTPPPAVPPKDILPPSTVTIDPIATEATIATATAATTTTQGHLPPTNDITTAKITPPADKRTTPPPAYSNTNPNPHSNPEIQPSADETQAKMNTSTPVPSQFIPEWQPEEVELVLDLYTPAELQDASGPSPNPDITGNGHPTAGHGKSWTESLIDKAKQTSIHDTLSKLTGKGKDSKDKKKKHLRNIEEGNSTGKEQKKDELGEILLPKSGMESSADKARQAALEEAMSKLMGTGNETKDEKILSQNEEVDDTGA